MKSSTSQLLTLDIAPNSSFAFIIVMSADDVTKTLASLSSVSMALSPIPSICRRKKDQILPALVMFGNFLFWFVLCNASLNRRKHSLGRHVA